MAVIEQVPNVVFKTRVRDESIGGDNPFKWQDVTTTDIFAGKRVIVFSLPGACIPFGIRLVPALPGFRCAASCGVLGRGVYQPAFY